MTAMRALISPRTNESASPILTSRLEARRISQNAFSSPREDE